MNHSPTSTRRLLPDGLRVSHMDARERPLVLLVEPVSTTARCPLCNSKSARVHSRYPRTLADLPWRGIAVAFKVHARKFFCENEGCERRIFCERLPDVAAYARKTERLEETLLSIAFELSGEAGARLARELGLLVSPDALLGRIRRTAPAPDTDAVRVLGLDDFAFRRGHRYGTILVDLESHRPIDRLPDRTVPTVRNWLDEHPGIEVVCRDRYSPYIEAIGAGAPEAIQVTDRWHLLKNLSEAVEKVLVRHRKALREAVEHAQPEAPKLPWGWVAFLKRRWEHGGFDVEETWEHLCVYCEVELSREDFDEFMRRLREGPTLHAPHAARRLAREEAKRRTPRPVARLISKDPRKLSTRDQRYLRALSEISPKLAEVHRLAQDFAAMVRRQSPEELEVWIEEALTVGPEALQDFAEGLGDDETAVRAAICQKWSSGQVEGRINKLKMLKRQMYGRANFDLLRARVLAS